MKEYSFGYLKSLDASFVLAIGKRKFLYVYPLIRLVPRINILLLQNGIFRKSIIVLHLN